MSGKYHGLPDIDTAQDIFETPDEPDTLLRPADNGLGEDDIQPKKPSSNDIDASELPGRKKVKKVFGRGIRRRDPKDLPFRPRLPPLSRYTLSTSLSSDDDEDHVDEGQNTRPQFRESATSKLRRLKAEIAELESEISSSSRPQASSSNLTSESIERESTKRKSVLPPKQPTNLISELNGLKSRLDNLDIDGLPIEDPSHNQNFGSSKWNERLKRLDDSHARQNETNNVDEGSREEDGKGENSLGEIDKRLAILENTLGPIGEGLDSNGPLIPTLTKHSHLLTLLTQPRQLDAISRRIKLLLVDLDRAASASKKSPAIHQGGGGGHASDGKSGSKTDAEVTLNNGEYQNLIQLFGLMTRLDEYLPIVKPLLIRLKSLNNLHEESSNIAESLKKMNQQDKSDLNDIKELQSILERLQLGLDDSSQSILKNWESTQSRMKSLEDRLKSLEQYSNKL
ncbi:uncharacterized protein L201_003071 [Kwoniella dendrophila CBS 6074]|uniref:Dynactin 2 n=1 Tax=Kwoniella dendrophila CBS 6074 TaxID=1295534 RepID=A0AAX4JRZ5_9TREE